MSQRARLPHVGFVLTHPDPADMAGEDPADDLARAFVHGLRDLGYTQGHNIVIESRSSQAHLERLPALMRQLVELKVDVIVTPGDTAVDEALRLTSTIPIVTVVFDPVADGYSKSLSRPTRNITGVTWEASAASTGKMLQLLKEAAPSVTRVGMLITERLPANSNTNWLPETEAALAALGMTMKAIPVSPATDIESLFASMRQDRFNGLFVGVSAFSHRHMRRIAEAAIRQGLPTIHDYAEPVRAGGLMSYGPNVPDMYRQLAAYVAKILGGASPRDLPFQQPTRLEFVVNLKTARALGLTLPRPLLLRADELVE